MKTKLDKIVKEIIATVGKKSGLFGYEKAKSILTAKGLDSQSYEYCIRQIVKRLKI